MSTKVLAFDIGIKNLAFGILKDKKEVLALENCNILEPVEKTKCFMCKQNASYVVGGNFFCKRHIPGTHDYLEELDGKKLPPVKTLKELVEKNDCEDLGKTKDKLIESLSKKFALPYKQEKQENANKLSLESIHDALRKFVQEKWELFKSCSDILLENQPVLKNPHMKSVQVLLFATLREKFYQESDSVTPNPIPRFHLVHAKKKVQGVIKGDEGYKERKEKSEERVNELLKNKSVAISKVIEDNWTKSKKKSDMADALCMCLDFIKPA
jgi:hypothetical protein